MHLYPTFVLMSLLTLFSKISYSQIENYQHTIPFQPAQYVCYFAATTPIIDGQIDEFIWQQTPWTTDFVDITGDAKKSPSLRTCVKALWDKEYLYVAAELQEPHVWATLTQHDTLIYMNDNFEIFLDPGNDGINYYEWEINANNVIWDLLLLCPYRVPNRQKMLNSWETPDIRHAVQVQGTKNNAMDRDTSWTVEFALPWKVLTEFAPDRRLPKDGEQWRANFMRVDWVMDIKHERYEKRPHSTTGKVAHAPDYFWAWSPVGEVNIHRPETWGYLQFSTVPVGTTAVNFVEQPNEQIRWALWQLHLQQLQFYQKNGRYATDLQQLSLPEVAFKNYQADFKMESNGRRYEILVTGVAGTETLVIDETGRLQSMNVVKRRRRR